MNGKLKRFVSVVGDFMVENVDKLKISKLNEKLTDLWCFNYWSNRHDRPLKPAWQKSGRLNSPKV